MAKVLHEIDCKTLKQWIDEGKCCVIDVREEAEYAVNRIPGAHLCPTSSFEPKELPDNGGKTYVFHCKAGIRSAKCAQKYLEEGPDEAYHLKGGMDAWLCTGGTVEANLEKETKLANAMRVIIGCIVCVLALLSIYVHPGFTWALAVFGGLYMAAGFTGICMLEFFVGKLLFRKS